MRQSYTFCTNKKLDNHLKIVEMRSGIPILFMNLHQVHLCYLSTLAKTTINDWGGIHTGD